MWLRNEYFKTLKMPTLPCGVATTLCARYMNIESPVRRPAIIFELYGETQAIAPAAWWEELSDEPSDVTLLTDRLIVVECFMLVI